MTQSTSAAGREATTRRIAPTPAGYRRRTAGQTVTIIILIISLVGSVLTRSAATRFQESKSPNVRHTANSRRSLAGMDSYALALLLGGLRGPLVMILWANSESQKADRDLEGIDTQIEWIRRLQPEFDTVHVFQMRNKAYNLSVQMVGLANKYTTILDALDYGKNIDAERPDNLNILREIGRIYSDKLGNSNPEKFYYRDRVRAESRYRESQSNSVGRGQPGFQRLKHDTLLDVRGNILPEHLASRRTPVSADGETYDGSDLQYLKQYQPFPYGISPYGLGYNYHKRAQVLMSALKQAPLQLSESVTDAQPALALKSWSEEEWERARRMEHKAFGVKLPAERIPQELPTAAVPVDAQPADASLLPEMIYSYDMAAKLAGDSLKEYERHLRNPEFATKLTIYASHMDQIRGIRALVGGDRDYLRAMQAKDAIERGKLLASAKENYQESIQQMGLTELRYFTSDRLISGIFPPTITRVNIGTGKPGEPTYFAWDQVLAAHQATRAFIDANGGPMMDENSEDRMEYDAYIARAIQRLQQIESAQKH
jgi:hypothetical protein